MVKMRRFLSIFMGVTVLLLTLNANEHYLLPEHRSDLMHTLKLKIERAEHLTIISSGLDNPSLAKSIEKAIGKKALFHLITTDLASAAYYAKYKNTSVKIPTSSRIEESFNLNILLLLFANNRGI